MQPQTIESINHARAADVPIVVAMNKIDRPDANPDMVLGQLAAQGLNPVEWGGDTEVIRTSAITGQGIQELIEILDYQSQLLELKADPTAPARGTVIESTHGPGPRLGRDRARAGRHAARSATSCSAGPGYGRIRSLLNDRGEPIQEAGPSTPVIVSGLNELPVAGDKFYVVDDIDRARVDRRGARDARRARRSSAGQNQRHRATTCSPPCKAGDVKTINLIIKADVQGSVETLVKTVTDQNTEEVKVRVIHSGVGAISESDVRAGDGDQDQADRQPRRDHRLPRGAGRSGPAAGRAEPRRVKHVSRDLRDLRRPEEGAVAACSSRRSARSCTATPRCARCSRSAKLGNIAGCFVTDGHIQRGSKIRLIRDGKVITEDLAIETLKRVKDDVKEVKAGFECGIKLAGYDDIKVGDVLEAYIRETIPADVVEEVAVDSCQLPVKSATFHWQLATDNWQLTHDRRRTADWNCRSPTRCRLKDKRRVIKSLKDRIAHGHNVSIAEVGALDEHRRSILGMAMVANDSRYVEGALSKLVDFVRADAAGELDRLPDRDVMRMRRTRP